MFKAGSSTYAITDLTSVSLETRQNTHSEEVSSKVYGFLISGWFYSFDIIIVAVISVLDLLTLRRRTISAASDTLYHTSGNF